VCHSEAATSPAEAWLPAGAYESLLHQCNPRLSQAGSNAIVLDISAIAERDFCLIVCATIQHTDNRPVVSDFVVEVTPTDSRIVHIG
jgi:hypothetical protein